MIHGMGHTKQPTSIPRKKSNSVSMLIPTTSGYYTYDVVFVLFDQFALRCAPCGLVLRQCHHTVLHHSVAEQRDTLQLQEALPHCVRNRY